RALESTHLVQVVNSAYGDNQVKVLCRVVKDADAHWIQLVERVLIATELEQSQAHGWVVHICRMYFLKDTDRGRKLVFGWNVAVQSTELGISLDFLSRVIRGEAPEVLSQKRPNETEEMEFTGMSGDRTPSPGGKGAYTIAGKSDFRPPRPSSGG